MENTRLPDSYWHCRTLLSSFHILRFHRCLLFPSNQQIFLVILTKLTGFQIHYYLSLLLVFILLSVIRTFFSSLSAPGLRHFYYNGNRSTECLQDHCSRYEIEPAEMETVISLGVLVLGAELLLRPTNTYDEKLKGVSTEQLRNFKSTWVVWWYIIWRFLSSRVICLKFAFLNREIFLLS